MKEVKAKEIRKAGRKSALKAPEQLTFTRTNYLLFALGVLVIIVGYAALAQPPVNSFMSLTVAPILLIIGYCVIIPAAILYQSKNGALAEGAKTNGR